MPERGRVWTRKLSIGGVGADGSDPVARDFSGMGFPDWEKIYLTRKYAPPR